METDIIEKGLKIVFTSVYSDSIRLGKLHYADEKNLFYKLLAFEGITDRELKPSEYGRLIQNGVGLLNIKRTYPDNALITNLRVEEFKEKIFAFQPSIICFNGKEPARLFFRKQSTKEVILGMQHETIGVTKLFVAPSTAFRVRQYFDEKFWHQLKELLGTLPT